MKINIVSVGKKHDKNLVVAIEEYEKRLQTYCKLEWFFIPSSDIAKESDAILRLVDKAPNLILLDENGIEVSNAQLAGAIEKAQNQSIKEIWLIIGGAYGVNREVANRADFRLKLSSLVFPHQIVRLIVVEQLYRSFSILAGNGYHHD